MTDKLDPRLRGDYRWRTDGQVLEFPQTLRVREGLIEVASLRVALNVAAAALKLFAIAATLLASAVCLVIAVVLWRSHDAPVRLDWAAPVIEWAAVRASPDVAACEVETVTLSKSADRAQFMVSVGAVDVFDAGGARLARFSSARFGFDANDLFAARLGPETILLEDATIRIVRRANRRIRLDYGEAWRGPANVFQSLTGGPYFRDAFRRARLRRANISFLDEASGRAWTASRASAEIRRTVQGYAASVNGAFNIGGEEAGLSLNVDYDRATDLIAADLSLAAAPFGDILQIFLRAPEPILTSSVTGRGAITLRSDGRVTSSNFIGRARGGALLVGGRMVEVKTLRTAFDFDAEADAFMIRELNFDTALARGAASGAVALEFDEPAAQESAGVEKDAAEPPKGPSGVRFDVEVEDLTVTAGEAMDGPVDITRLDVAGKYSVRDRKATLADISLEVSGAKIDGAMTYAAVAGSDAGGAPEIKGALRIDGRLSREEVLSLWPRRTAWAARRFVDERVFGATFEDVRFDIDLEAGAPLDNGVPEDAMSLRFRARDASLAYAPGMTPLTSLRGAGELKGNSFRFDAEAGRVGPVRLIEGSAHIPRLRPKGQPAVFSFVAEGEAGDILAVLDEEPLAVLKSTAFDAAQFSGRGRVAGRITRPNQRDVARADYRYEANADFDAVTIEDFFRDTPLVAAETRVSVTTGALAVGGEATLGGAPVTIDWRQRFEGAGERTTIKLTGLLDSRLGDLVGAPLRQFVRGAAPFTAEARGDLRSIRSLSVDIDFTGVDLFSEAIGWRKPAGAPARGEGRVELAGGRPASAGLTVDGAGIKVDGALAFTADGAFREVVFERLHLDEVIDARLAARVGPGGGLDLELTGPRLDLGGVVQRYFNAGRNAGDRHADGSGGGFEDLFANASAAARIDALSLRNGVVLHDAALDMRHGPRRLETLSFLALDKGGRRLSIDLDRTGARDGPQQNLVARTDNIGAFLSGVFGVTSVRGGEGVVEFDFGAAEDAAEDAGDSTGRAYAGSEAGAVGKLEARNLRVVNAPVLAQIFAAGSLPGLADLVTGEGIEVSQGFADFSVGDGRVTLRNARAAGPSVGLTAQGSFALGGDEAFVVTGAFAPAYQLNSLLGKAPLLGDLFVNRDGEGVIALAYAVGGRPSAPTISVNPLSALTPGVFRRMFEAGKEEAGETP